MINAADKTLKSLKKVNDFPFYTARYHGDYKLNDFKTGVIKSQNDIIPFFEDLFGKLGKPIKLQLLTMLSVHSGSYYPSLQDSISVGDYNIIRIILDTCKNVDEVISTFQNYNLIQTGLLPLHYLVADKDESCIVEFFDEEIKISRNCKINYLTNFLKLKSNNNKCNRYDTLNHKLENRINDINIREAKEILNDVSVYKDGYEVPSTIWSLVYDQQNLKMNIKIGKSSTYYSIGL